jgi:hypothetical protein
LWDGGGIPDHRRLNVNVEPVNAGVESLNANVDLTTIRLPPKQKGRVQFSLIVALTLNTAFNSV